jgi:hypothetical protein
MIDLDFPNDVEQDVVDLHYSFVGSLGSINLQTGVDDSSFLDQSRIVLRVEWSKKCLECEHEEPTTAAKTAVLAMDVHHDGVPFQNLSDALASEFGQNEHGLDCARYVCFLLYGRHELTYLCVQLRPHDTSSPNGHGHDHPRRARYSPSSV